MADNFGPQQNRVLNVTHRNLDNVVFQYRKPPLTSEWNLVNQISNEKVQEIARASYPSGWLTVGDILQDVDESNAITGQVNCSATYEANSFKLFSKNDNIAIVNGWPLIIQGTNSPDVNNIIRLGEPGGQLYDFVFLEVWRKLVGKDDPVYPYGNVLLNPYSDNEIEWPVVGTETTKRVQIQYRLRVADINTTLNPTSDGFDTTVYPIGGRTAGEYEFASYAFRKHGSADIGLYISGDGSEASQTALGTVDGYVYAIPMFMVCRRLKWDTIFEAAAMRHAFVNKAELSDGYVSDRPDGALADVIYKDDIVDFRHKVISSGKDVGELVDQTVSKLIAGELTTALKSGFGANGSTTTASIGGGTLTKVECLNVSGSMPSIGIGSDTGATTFKRRAFCNAEIVHDHNVVEIPHTGVWVAGNTFDPVALLTLPDGEITTVDGFYHATVGLVTGITPGTPDAPTTYTVGPTSNIIGQTKLLMEFTFKYASSPSGFKDVPREFLEVNKGTYLPIATRDNDIALRFNNGHYLLNYGTNPGSGDPGETDPRDFLRYKGGNYTENTAFGHEMVIYRTTNGSGVVTITLSDSTYAGYQILGVKSVEPETAPGVYGDPIDFAAQRAATMTLLSYTVDSYSVTVGSYPNTAIRIALYVGSKAPYDVGEYFVEDSLKFFELSKQGRGVIDTYEVIEVIGEEIGGTGIYSVDTGDKPIIALLTKAKKVSGFVEGSPFGWLFNSTGNSIDITYPNNQNIPVLSSASYSPDLTPTRIKVTSASGLSKIRVPVLVHSYVTQSETPYNFFYKANAYQGLLDSSTVFYGKVTEEGPALVTSLGSGSISNYYYTTGRVLFQSGVSARVVVGVSDTNGNTPKWSAYVKSGDYIKESASDQYYRILSVDSDTQLTLAELYAGIAGLKNYEIVRVDVSHDNISNVVDRLPSLFIEAGSTEDLVDYRCYSDNVLSGANTFHGVSFTKAKQKMQDPLNAMVNDFVVGASSSSKRGRNNFILTNGQNDIFKLSDTPRPHALYEYTQVFSVGHEFGWKVYQVYLFNMSAKGVISGESDLTGRLYLMVISGETKPVPENTGEPAQTLLNGFFNRDTVDLFELVGRPIVKMY
jgi:hypothetical protein